MTKALALTENSKNQSDNTKTQPKTSITQRVRTELGRDEQCCVYFRLLIIMFAIVLLSGFSFCFIFEE